MLEEKAAEKHEAKMKELSEKIRHDLPLADADLAAWRRWVGTTSSASSSAGRRRKRNKRRRKAFLMWAWMRSLRGSVLMCSSPYCKNGRACRRQLQWYVHGWVYWCRSPRCVPFFCSQAQDARRFGRYEPEGQLCSTSVSCAFLVLLVSMLSRCVPFDCRQAGFPQVPWSRWCRTPSGGAAVAVHFTVLYIVVDVPVVQMQLGSHLDFGHYFMALCIW